MTRKAPREQRLDEILNAAVAVFLEKGYEGASMEAVAARAGLTKGGLYHHFGSKDEILLAANQHFARPVMAFMESAAADSSPLRGLRGYIRNYLEHWTTHPREVGFIFLSLTKALGASALQQLYAEYYRETVRFLEDLLQRAAAAGEIRPHDVRGRAVCLLGALDGVLGLLITDPDTALDAVVRWFDATFLAPGTPLPNPAPAP